MLKSSQGATRKLTSDLAENERMKNLTTRFTQTGGGAEEELPPRPPPFRPARDRRFVAARRDGYQYLIRVGVMLGCHTSTRCLASGKTYGAACASSIASQAE